jgi:hypothetical protein
MVHWAGVFSLPGVLALGGDFGSLQVLTNTVQTITNTKQHISDQIHVGGLLAQVLTNTVQTNTVQPITNTVLNKTFRNKFISAVYRYRYQLIQY